MAKRVITEARKEQNRLSQRAYRRRQKEQKRLQKQYFSSGPRKLEPRRDGVEATFSPSSFLSSQFNATSGNPYSVCPPVFSGFTEGDNLIHSDMDLRAYRPHSLEIGVHEFLSPAVFEEGAATGSLAPDSVAVHQEDSVELHIGNLVPDIGRSLEDNRTAVLRACLSNALCIGINLTELMYCEQPCMSSFYQPTNGAKESLLFTNSSYDFLPLSLKPTSAQILIPHHASLDLIPLPRLRERVILISAALPHIFSLGEMKLDIYTRDGLVCQDFSDPNRSSLQPWDIRSWKAAPWFLRKWEMVVDVDEISACLALPGIPGLWL